MILKIYLPAAIRYGVPYETFWHLNPCKLMIYQDEYNRKLEDRARIIDFTAWRNGMYIVNAIQAGLMPKKARYPSKPYSESRQEESLSGEEEFMLWVAEFNAQHPDLPEENKQHVRDTASE